MKTRRVTRKLLKDSINDSEISKLNNQNPKGRKTKKNGHSKAATSESGLDKAEKKKESQNNQKGKKRLTKVNNKGHATRAVVQQLEDN